MEVLQYMRVHESGKSDTVCINCMTILYGPEEAWVSDDDKYFCCRECVEQYEVVQRGY